LRNKTTHPKTGKLQIQKKKCAAKNLDNQKQMFCLSAANETLVQDGDLRSTRKLAESGDASIAKLTSSSAARHHLRSTID
jgi:hypothetical protein